MSSGGSRLGLGKSCRSRLGRQLSSRAAEADPSKASLRCRWNGSSFPGIAPCLDATLFALPGVEPSLDATLFAFPGVAPCLDATLFALSGVAPCLDATLFAFLGVAPCC